MKVDAMKHGDKMQSLQAIPWWLKRLNLVQDELRGMRFPRTAEEGLRQCAELSDVSMHLLRDEVRKSLRTRDEKKVEIETRRLMARFSSIDTRWRANRRTERGTPKGE